MSWRSRERRNCETDSADFLQICSEISKGLWEYRNRIAELSSDFLQICSETTKTSEVLIRGYGEYRNRETELSYVCRI